MDRTLQELVQLSRYLGDPKRDFAILGEGNTAARIDDKTFYVKASGVALADIGPEGFVQVRTEKALSILEDEGAGDEEVTRVLRESLVDPKEPRRPSVETILHAILLQVPEYAFVAHAHPVYANMLLCSKVAEEAASGRIFPDQVVLMGPRSVYVPYVDPGLPLAREVKRRFENYVEEEGILPRTILMQNHGVITMGNSPKAVLGCLEMVEKSSRILVGAYAVGGPNFLAPEHVARIFTRPDEAYRLTHIAGTDTRQRS